MITQEATDIVLSAWQNVECQRLAMPVPLRKSLERIVQGLLDRSELKTASNTELVTEVAARMMR